MNKVFCSTGALIGRPNNRNYKLLSEVADKLTFDGFEFLVYDTWYPEINDLIKYVKPLGLNIPVVHCEKSLSEKLSGSKIVFSSGEYKEYPFTKDEDRIFFNEAIEEFKVNLHLANEFGSDRMVFHLWNGLVSDRYLDRNLERFSVLKELADEAGILLLVENVICNVNSPLIDVGITHEKYPDVSFVYDTKMAQFHGETLDVFNDKWNYLFKEHLIRHLHINDYDGGIKEWNNLKVLPIGKGHVDFKSFFENLSSYEYSGDYTVEATAFDKVSGVIDIDMLNKCCEDLRNLIFSRET